MILSCNNITKTFGTDAILSDCSFHIEEREKATIVGPNGAGKSTLLKIIMGRLPADDGTVTISKDKTLGYLAQHQNLSSDGTIYDELLSVKKDIIALEEKIRETEQQMKNATGEQLDTLLDQYTKMNHQFELENGYAYQSEIVGVLKGLGFTEDDFSLPVNTLSGGQKTRVALGRLLLQNPDLIILDEPTNHMDMRSKDILKNAIMKYDGTVVVVSHDREFLDGMVEKVYEFRDGGVKEYLGGIYYFLEKRKLESLQEIERRDAPAKMPAKGDEPKPAVSGKLSYEQRKEQEKQLRKAKKVVETIEAELADIEKRIAEYDARFAAATEYNEADYKAYNELKTRYDHQMHEWEKASYELEIIENE